MYALAVLAVVRVTINSNACGIIVVTVGYVDVRDGNNIRYITHTPHATTIIKTPT